MGILALVAFCAIIYLAIKMSFSTLKAVNGKNLGRSMTTEEIIQLLSNIQSPSFEKVFQNDEGKIIVKTLIMEYPVEIAQKDGNTKIELSANLALMSWMKRQKVMRDLENLYKSIEQKMNDSAVAEK